MKKIIYNVIVKLKSLTISYLESLVPLSLAETSNLSPGTGAIRTHSSKLPRQDKQLRVSYGVISYS